jgi:hypothetical protein
MISFKKKTKKIVEVVEFSDSEDENLQKYILPFARTGGI